MMKNQMIVIFISGMQVMAYLIICLFFFRFARQAHDRLFLLFGVAFFLLGVQRFALVVANANDSGTTWIYGMRLAAFLLFLFAIIDKNRAPRRPAKS